MADYASMKVPELKKLLAERKLPVTGNKADLIARLTEEDAKPAADAEAKPGTLARDIRRDEGYKPTTMFLHRRPAILQRDSGKDDEITYSDDEGAKPAAPAAPAAATEAVPAASAAPNDAAADAAAPTKGDAAPAAAEPEPAEPVAPPPSFAMGLSSTTAGEEAKKRADRAKRFGLDEDNEDAKKRVERTQRFGLEDKDVSGLDAALPERNLKRGRGQHQDGQRPGKRQSTDRRGNDRRNGGRNDRQGGGGNTQARGSGILNNPAERAKAEKRAARFAAA
ncbi:DNA-binding SAP [Cordyceps militaris]|uniref:DNA-binding SAP n=1 Tax=Cordyceps militaris TaxID=73501 RepID=A0A2H4SJ47_CORMI|nr:DNA-binding SAP [Cordyceps militaris]